MAIDADTLRSWALKIAAGAAVATASWLVSTAIQAGQDSAAMVRDVDALGHRVDDLVRALAEHAGRYGHAGADEHRAALAAVAAQLEAVRDAIAELRAALARLLDAVARGGARSGGDRHARTE